MKKLNLTIAASLFTLVLSGNLSAQDTNTDNHTVTVSIPEVALVDIEPAATKTLRLDLQHLQKQGTLLFLPQPILLYGLTILPSNLLQILPVT